MRRARQGRAWGAGGGGGDGGCTVQGDSDLARWWQHQNLTSHAFSQQSPLHIMCWEMKSICFERLTLKLDVLRLSETGVTGSNNACEGEELGSRDAGVI